MSFKLARQVAGLPTLTALHKRTGIDLGALSRYESGRQVLRRSRYDIVEKIASALDLYPHELIAIVEGRRRVGNVREHRAPR